jgi:hypothetical protein
MWRHFPHLYIVAQNIPQSTFHILAFCSNKPAKKKKKNPERIISEQHNEEIIFAISCKSGKKDENAKNTSLKKIAKHLSFPIRRSARHTIIVVANKDG